jgi:hypothetical protein
MTDDWDSAPSKPVAKAVSKDPRFTDEDQEEPLKDWDAEEEAPKAYVPVPVKPKQLTKHKLKKKEEEEKRAREAEERKLKEELENSPEARAAAHRKNQKMSEDSDKELIDDLFGGPAPKMEDVQRASAAIIPLKKPTNGATSDAKKPAATANASTGKDPELKEVKDYESYAETVSKHVTKEGKNTSKLLAFLTKTLQISCQKLQPEEILKLKESINKIYNERQKAIEDDKKKKKAGATKKATVNVKVTKDFSDHTEHTHDAVEDFDYL